MPHTESPAGASGWWSAIINLVSESLLRHFSWKGAAESQQPVQSSQLTSKSSRMALICDMQA